MQQQIQLQLQLATCLCHLPLYAIATCHICKAFSLRTEYLNNFRLCLFLFFFYFFTFTFATLSCNYKCLMATRNREVPFRWPASTAPPPMPPRPATPSLLAPLYNTCPVQLLHVKCKNCLRPLHFNGHKLRHYVPICNLLSPSLSLSLSPLYALSLSTIRVINKMPNKGMHCK